MTINSVQGMNWNLRTKKGNPTLYRGSIVCQTDRRKCKEVSPGSQERDMVERQRGGWSRITHTKPTIILAVPLSCWRLGWMHLSRSTTPSRLCYSFIWIMSGMRQRMKKIQYRWGNCVCTLTQIKSLTGKMDQMTGWKTCHCCWAISLNSSFDLAQTTRGDKISCGAGSCCSLGSDLRAFTSTHPSQ